MPRRSIAALTAGVVSIAFAAAAWSQATSPSAPAASPRADKAAGREAGKSNLSSGDRKFMEKAAQGGMIEVQLGKIAAEKGSSEQVKAFGRRMVEDHTKANDELKQLASAKGVALPAELDRSHRKEYERLSKLSGAEFDREYMAHMVKDHKRDVSDFRSQAKSAKDPDLKAFAEKTLPTLEQHLQLAQQTEKAVKDRPSDKTAAPARGTDRPGSSKSGG